MPQAASSNDAPVCSGTFISHELAHTTRVQGRLVLPQESNGAGVGIGDLNNDGLLDVVLGNSNGANSILWNEGGLNFRAETFMPTGRTHAVSVVDVNADGWLDIMVSTQAAIPRLWLNKQNGTFQGMTLNRVTNKAHTLNWYDVDGDGDLDLVTASNNVELGQFLGANVMFNNDMGVFYYENQGGTFIPTQLAEESHGLATWIADLNQDGAVDLVVGNDYRVPDQSWSFINGAWQPMQLFQRITFQTMSFDSGDINNDGVVEFFASDMLPYQATPDIQKVWDRVIGDIDRIPLLPDDPQSRQNMLQMRGADGQFVDQSEAFGVKATGWTWASKFGDLNQDGYLDLYVVNGMMSNAIFADLPNAELVESDLAWRNQNGQRFVPAPEWGLGSTASGRGMSMADLDNDGDLDIVVNNLTKPAQLFENQLCEGASLQVELRWTGSQNPFAIGASATLHTSTGDYQRDMRVISGYLSGDPARLHFGFPKDSQLLALDIHWPDGEMTHLENFPAGQKIITLTR